jgi:homopolymeric O-antigen transport system ATP-binding protein
MSDVALVAAAVSKKFRRGELYDSLRDLVPALLRKLARPGPRDALLAQEFWAVREVSFEVHRGEAFGIIGRNGAGKSTILKLLAGVMQPTLGELKVHGRLSALIEVGAGFHPDLTGRENVFLNGTILGMSRDEIRRKFDAIVEFSGLEEFIDTPVKRYSSGMFARLGFAVAAHVDPDVLIVDEVLSVGDFVFQRRCLEKMDSVLRGGATIVFVSHDLRAVAHLCSRTALMDRGRLTAIGSSDEVIRQYLGTAADQEHRVEGKDAYLSRVRVRGAGGETATFQSGEKAWVDVEVTAAKDVGRLAVVLDIRSDDDRQVFNTSSERLGAGSFSLKAGETFTCSFELDLHLAHGTFRLAAYVHRYDIERQYDQWYPAAILFVGATEDVRGIANLHPMLVAFGPPR